MNTIEIGDEEIDVEEIMRKIRENIRKRRESGVYTEEMKDLIDEPLQTADTGESNIDHLRQELNYINRDWDTRAEYSISSHRRFIGWLLIKGRQLVHCEVRRYVDLIVGKQIEFNAHVVHFVNRLIPGIEDRLKQARTEISEEINDRVGLAKTEIGSDFDDKLGLAKTEIGSDFDDKLGLVKTEIGSEFDDKLGLVKTEISLEFDDKLGLVKTEIGSEFDDKLGLVKTVISGEIDDKVSQMRAEIGSEIGDNVNEVVAKVNEDIKNKAWLANLLEKKIVKKPEEELPVTGTDESMNFFVFEEKFRGAREDIKERQLKFLEYSRDCKNVLDIGCGRGEFLEILKENGINAKGIDINEDMVGYCQSKRLNVEKADAIEYLEKIEDKSLDSIFLDQVVEHLEPKYLIKLLELCHKKLKFGYYIVIETVNPLSLTSFANFYIDLSHKKPIHPETLKFLSESAGFREIEVKFFSPIPDEYKLKKVEVCENIGVEEKEREIIEVYNHNIEKLNETLYGHQDYAVIGKK
jgi:O-antigen chain-terminating methyltransferase